VDDLVVPFIFVPTGDPDPTEWLAQHPGAIKIPAVFVPRAGGRSQLQVDLNSTLEGIARDGGFSDEAILPRHTEEATPVAPAAEPALAEPEDPIAAYLRSDGAVKRYLAAFGGTGSASSTKTDGDFDGPTSSDIEMASCAPRVMPASSTATAPRIWFDPVEDLKQGLHPNPDGTIKE